MASFPWGEATEKFALWSIDGGVHELGRKGNLQLFCLHKWAHNSLLTQWSCYLSEGTKGPLMWSPPIALFEEFLLLLASYSLLKKKIFYSFLWLCALFMCWSTKVLVPIIPVEIGHIFWNYRFSTEDYLLTFERYTAIRSNKLTSFDWLF